MSQWERRESRSCLPSRTSRLAATSDQTRQKEGPRGDVERTCVPWRFELRSKVLTGRQDLQKLVCCVGSAMFQVDCGFPSAERRAYSTPAAPSAGFSRLAGSGDPCTTSETRTQQRVEQLSCR